MSHLDPETLARIVDEPASAPEAEHLGACGTCRDQLAALREQKAALRALPARHAPAAVWRGVAARLELEGRPVPVPLAGERRRSKAAVRLLAAAALGAVFLAGALAGAAIDRDATDVAATDEPPARTEAARELDPEETLHEAEVVYAAALARYMAEHPEPGAGVDPMRRLAALESIILTAGAALDERPDPVIAGYYRTALAQREALLSQVALADEEAWF